MTPLAIIYFVLGALALLWPLALLFYRRSVLPSQWLIMAAMALFGLAAICYSTLFNTFLKGEYLLVLIYMALSLSVPPVVDVATKSLTRLQGIDSIASLPGVLSVAILLAMALAVVAGGGDMYSLWIERGVEGEAGMFFESSHRYNYIVAVHYYAYGAVLAVEVAYVLAMAVIRFVHYSHTAHEYYSTAASSRTEVSVCFVCMIVVSVNAVVSLVLYPFNVARPIWVVAPLTAVQVVAMLVMGYLVYRINYGAERLAAKRATMPRGRHRSTADMKRALAEYVERERGFLNPDISVFSIAEHLHVSEDEVVDAIHRIHGHTFAAWIDALRVEYAVGLLLAAGQFDASDTERVAELAHRCGYLQGGVFCAAFGEVMQMSLERWCAAMLNSHTSAPTAL